MKNEKNVALAQRIIDRKEEWTNTEWGNDCRWEVIDDDYLKKIICEEVESEALASKVVGPSDEGLFIAATDYLSKIHHLKESEYEQVLIVGSFSAGARWLRSQITLAPNEQVIRVPKVDWELGKYPNGHPEITRRLVIHEIKRLNPTARIEESNE